MHVQTNILLAIYNSVAIKTLCIILFAFIIYHSELYEKGKTGQSRNFPGQSKSTTEKEKKKKGNVKQ